ncbi:SusC/RagA family TonB-linked outer membrane protein [Pedobacter africanus]|uniref:TonB-linked SusC/RagA family outer membrane protein n=1 Tax=Pedobacter africanus TaxID=151894 RepID=A0ACC6KQM9_9SPHI|nr:SusC/RagA family TonB-linked outer membrane protein [Pedobacter africanus]MDR6781478.1 TonB-linked SusC/RagA family outer membrane protein [Pedobacter africanus]
MRLTIAILVASLMHVSASGLAQKITLHKSNASLQSIFKALKDQSGYNFFYTDNLLKDASPVDLDVRNTDLKDVLQLLFAGQNLDYLVRDKTVIIQARKAQPQEIISGFVGDKKTRQPIPGVTVSIKGTKSMVQTDKNGKFTISVPSGATSLEFRFLGYKAANLPIQPNSNYTIYLEEDEQSLKETVITGLTERKAATYTGAAKTITQADLKSISAGNIFAGVAAMDPSFRIMVNNAAGADLNQLPDIQIRGANSFVNIGTEMSGNPNLPLFILDNFEVSLQQIVDLDINRIEAITILKDASATAIYGSRGANGVMVITTIPPKPGTIQVNLNNDFEFQSPDLSVYHLLNSREKLDFEQRAGLVTNYFQEYLYNERYKNMASGVNTNWLSIPVQSGYTNRTSLSLAGGDRAIRYNLSGTVALANGVMKGMDNKRYQGSFRLAYSVKKVQFMNTISLSQRNANASPYGNFSQYVGMNPYWKPYDENGQAQQYIENIRLSAAESSLILNPLRDVMFNTIDNRENELTVSNTSSVRYDINKSIFVEGSFNLQKVNGRTDNFYSALDSRFATVTDVTRKGTYSVANSENLTLGGQAKANFIKGFGRHMVTSSLIAEIRNSQLSNYLMNAEGFPFDRLDNLLFATQYEANGKPSGNESTVRTLGFTFSGNYTYDNRYFTDLSLRRDGSSQYGTNKRFGTNWSAGLGWNLHNETFLKAVKWINTLRLRGSYGSTGSLNIPAYGAQFMYAFNANTGYYNELGAQLNNLGNADLSWQQVLKANVGITASLFNNRLALDANLYRDVTQDALTSISLAPSTGFTSFSDNLGKLQNTGLELDVRYKVIDNRAKNISWFVNVNGLTNKNILKELSDRFKSSNDRLNSGNPNQTAPNPQFVEGNSMSAIYVVPSLGIDPVTGQEVFINRYGEKTFNWDVNDKVAFGDTNPTWSGNINSTLNMGGFNFTLSFRYQFGGQIYNSTLLQRVEGVNARNNVDRRAYDLGWKFPGDESLYKRIVASPVQTQSTSRFVQDDDFLHLTTVRVGYRFDGLNSGFIRKAGMNSLTISAITNDIYRFATTAYERGTNTPFARTYSLSLSAGF